MDQYVVDLDVITGSVSAGTKGFWHSAPLSEYTVSGANSGETVDVAFDLRDMMIVAAVSGTNVLLNGTTGCGKTTFSRAVLGSIFGSNYGFLQIDTRLSENQFRDISFKDIKEGSGTLSEAVRVAKTLTAPAVLLNEYNRASQLSNLLQEWLVNGVVILDGGKEVMPGTQLPDGSQYQFKIATINEGNDYSGTTKIDRASRDRFAIEIPMDSFPPTEDDLRQLNTGGRFKHISSEDAEDHSEAIFRLHAAAQNVPADPMAVEFSLYLSKQNNCYESPQGTKLTIDNFNTTKCAGCPAYAVDNGVCGEIYAPSQRVIADTFELSRAFAMYRAYKYPGTELTVTSGDYLAAARFTMFNKLGISAGWVQRHGGGSAWEATDAALKTLESKLMDTMASAAPVMIKSNEGRELDEEDKQTLKQLLVKDPSFFSTQQVALTFKDRHRIVS